MPDHLLTISSFARRVGLTPSALRFYDDCGLLPPAEVDDGNGYRYYSPDQESRATLLRDLREIDLPLADVRVVLDAGPDTAAEIVRGHLRTVELRAEAARRAAQRILGAASGGSTVTVGGPEFASAVRQVSPSASTKEDLPALACVLLEIGPDELKLVATDRYRLSVRQLHPMGFTGSPRRLLVPAGALAELGLWAAAAGEVRLETGPDLAVLVRDGETRHVPVVAAEFPAYEVILAGLAPTSRVIVDRAKLLAALTGGTVALDIGPDSLTVSGAELTVSGAEPLAAICTGSPVRLGFDSGLLAAALGASVGPDVLLEIGAADRPVVVRSADQGTFTTLVMPTKLDG